ncbi:MAG: hypothetical protein ACFFDX_05005 [Candidatus Odinarchaeota archaeon]
MVKKKSIAIIFVVFLIIGIIHGSIAISLNIFLTWIFIGLWIIFTVKIFENIKQHREFNSPHNTAFFVIIPLFIGIFYSIWGYFTGILGENLLDGSNLYFSWWSLIFGFPFIIYGSYSLYRCFKKYNVIYFGTKSVKARILGYILTSTVILFIIIYWVMFYAVIEFYDSPITPLHFSLNLNLLLLFIASLLIFVIFGLASSHRTLPALTRDYIAQRTRKINSLSTPTIQRQRERTTTRTTPSPSRRTVTQTTRSRSYSSRTTPTSHRQKTKTTKTIQTRAAKTTSKAINLARYKPRASYLSEDDFKCIFCFKLPKLPNDNGRGIIVCPNCRYPAHADEFKDWLKTSNLCSRCSTPIPSKFRHNPRIISIKNYQIIYRHFLKKKM